MASDDSSCLKAFGLTYSQQDSRQMQRILREYGKLPENPGSRPELFVALAALAKSSDDLEAARIFSWIEHGGDFPTPNIAKHSQAGDGNIEESQGSSMNPVLLAPVRPVNLVDDEEALAIRLLYDVQVEEALAEENTEEDDVRQSGIFYDEFGLVVEIEDTYDDTDFEGNWGSVDAEEEQEEEDLIDLSSDTEDFPRPEQSPNDEGTLSTADPPTTGEQSEALQLEQAHLHDTKREAFPALELAARLESALAIGLPSKPTRDIPEGYLECAICVIRLPASEFPTSITPSCSYKEDRVVCVTCIKNSITAVVDEGLLNLVMCPLCSEVLTPSEVKKYASDRVMARYEYLLKSLDSERVFCLAPGCGPCQIHKDVNDPTMVCETCSYKMVESIHGRPIIDPQQKALYDHNAENREKFTPMALITEEKRAKEAREADQEEAGTSKTKTKTKLVAAWEKNDSDGLELAEQ